VIILDGLGSGYVPSVSERLKNTGDVGYAANVPFHQLVEDSVEDTGRLVGHRNLQFVVG
jgi:hypothetical protein